MARRKSQPNTGRGVLLGSLLRRGSKPRTTNKKPSKGSGKLKAPKKPTIRRRALKKDPPSPDVDLPPLDKLNRVPRVSKEGLSLDRKLDIIGMVLMLLSFIILLGALSASGGALTEAITRILSQVFGWWAFPFLVLLHLLGWWLVLRNFREKPARIEALRVVGFLLFSITLLSMTHFLGMLTTDPDLGIDAFNAAKTGQGGGYIGAYIYQASVDAIGNSGTGLVLSGALLIGIMLTLDISIGEIADFLRASVAWLRAFPNRSAATAPAAVETVALPTGAVEGTVEILPESPPPPALPANRPSTASAPAKPEGDPDTLYGPPLTISTRQDWGCPNHAEILDEGSDEDINDDLLVEQARVIEDTLKSFGAPGRVVEINPGPVITQFGVEPDYLTGRNGKKVKVKVSKIAALADDIALALAARSVRVEAPVPGKGFVGVEVPNPKSLVVNLREVMESTPFKKLKANLRIGMGQSVDGEPIVVDLTIMPHLLIAGATGSGKSVCVNAIIACLLLQHSPADLRFIMIDPKRVELTTYNGIPHLMTPVVTDVNRTVGHLKWVTREMDDRYRRFARAGARNIVSYNKKLKKGTPKLPYLVVVVDELADLMMMAPQETEAVITRIAQMARATGIHLILSTQRPSVDVVTGLIKANFPARIAFMVASGVDSRVILDMPGAEKLLGRGDMLYQSPDASAALRLQGVFVSDEEIDRLVEFWRAQNDQTTDIETSVPTLVEEDKPAPKRPPRTKPKPPSAPTLREAVDSIIERDGAPPEDDLYPNAEKLVRRLDKASTSLLQRHLRIGYNRASRLMDMLEERGVVGPAESANKPRAVLSREGAD